MDAQSAAYLRELVFNRQHQRWSMLQRNGGFAAGKMLRMLGGGGGDVEALLILEHPLADEESMLCEGRPIGAWRLNTFGLCEITVGSFERLQHVKGRWPFELVRFAVDLGMEPVVYVNELSSADRGVLSKCEAVRTPRGLKLNVAKTCKYRPAQPAAATPEAVVTTQAALAFLRGDDRRLEPSPAG